MYRSLLISCVFALVLSFAAPALAWQPIATCTGGANVNWPNSDIPNTWVLRDRLTGARNFYSRLDDSQVIAAITSGWDVWEGQQANSCCSAWQSTYAGTTAASALTTNNEHIIEFIENSWPSGYGSVNSTIAVTIPQWSGCDFVDADQVYNGVGFQFTTTNNPGGGDTDLQSIAAHENGHWLGLDHTPVTSATMYASYGGGIGPRSLHDDDSTGVCTLYPGNCGPVEGNCSDGVDGDADGDVDCFDSDCSTDPACTCLATAVLPCNGSVNGNTSSAANTVTDWSCANFQSTGPELVYTVVSSVSGQVTIDMNNLVNDLDLYAATGTGNACDPTSCIGVSAEYNQDPEQIQFNASAGTTYFIAVDGWQGASGSFTLSASCPGAGPTNETSCTNGLDDDSDGLADCDDTDCAADPACNLPSNETSCSNGIDDDGDGLADCNDSDCAADPVCNIPANETSCTNGIDDDQDGLSDCADSDCASDPSCATAICVASAVLQCGSTVNGTTQGGATDVDTWNCAGWQTTGPEDVYSLTVGQAGTVTIDLTNLSDDIDLFVTTGVNGACDPAGCIGASGEYNQDPEQVVFTAAAGTTYYIVADGWQGNFASYTLAATCPGTAPTTEFACDDGLDNDSDGAMDCADSDCAGDPACASSCQNAGNCCDLADSANCDPCEVYLYETGDTFGLCSCNCQVAGDCPTGWSCVDIGGGTSACWPGTNTCEDPEVTPTPTPSPEPSGTSSDTVILEDDDGGIAAPPGLTGCNCSSVQTTGADHGHRGLPLALIGLLLPAYALRRRRY